MIHLPNALVLDCTVTVPWYLTDEASALSEALFLALGQRTMVVPVLWRLEFVSAIRSAIRRGRIPQERQAAILSQAARLPMHQDSLALDVAELGRGCAEFEVTPYDYVYLALARQRGLPLATFDAALVRACHRAGVEVLTQADRIAEPEPEFHAPMARRKPASRRIARS